MGFFDALFGRRKPVPVGPERLFAMSTAQVALESDQRLEPTGDAGICFRGIASGPFGLLQADLEQLLKMAGKDEQVTMKSFEDELNYRWFVFTSPDFQSLVATIHIVSQTLIEKGYDTQLLFAIFAFKNADGKPIYWIYNYKRGTFYPFVPQSDSHDKTRQRNNPEEMRLATVMEKELPLEKDLQFWYPVWDLQV